MATVGEIFNQYKEEFVRCSRGSAEDCNQVVEQVVKENIVEVIQAVPPDMWFWIWIGLGVLSFLFLLWGIRIIRPYERCLVETLGKYKKTFDPGFHWIVPIIQRTIRVDMTERMKDIEPQSVITRDNLNATVDGVLYFKVLDPRAAIYNVDNFKIQLANLAKTSLRAVIGKMELSEANENRSKINADIEKMLDEQIMDYGVDVMRVEIQKVDPPQDVQDSMNEMVKAEREKQAEKDRALQAEIKADGESKARIKNAEGIKQAAILEAEGKAEAFQLIEKSFSGNAKHLKQLEVTQASLERNSKIIIAERGTKLQTIIGNLPTESDKE